MCIKYTYIYVIHIYICDIYDLYTFIYMCTILQFSSTFPKSTKERNKP